MVVSGSCIGVYNTPVYWALHSLGANTVLLSLMATVSALPFTLFTLPAGALTDMVDRKKILLAVQLWHAALAFAMAILWMAHLLNPYIILASAFLISAGFAFGSPAHSSVIAEMVSPEELSSAYTLAGLQMDVSGIIGPLLSALLLPLAGVSFIFGLNGLGFVLMFLAVLQWKRPKAQSSLPLENFRTQDNWQLLGLLGREDLDWGRERLRVPERKAGHSTAYPLSPIVSMSR